MIGITATSSILLNPWQCRATWPFWLERCTPNKHHQQFVRRLEKLSGIRAAHNGTFTYSSYAHTSNSGQHSSPIFSLSSVSPRLHPSNNSVATSHFFFSTSYLPKTLFGIRETLTSEMQSKTEMPLRKMTTSSFELSEALEIVDWGMRTYGSYAGRLCFDDTEELMAAKIYQLRQDVQYQIRFLSFNGIMVVDKKLKGIYLCLRESLNKFEDTEKNSP
ncbi:hypothetical protein EDB19DRAFT_1922001 [Suillus lakei]|nr:hypothetical protein EDB19DRAFT_1922001 [Suillus lakei]